jgi:hypothetical protein
MGFKAPREELHIPRKIAEKKFVPFISAKIKPKKLIDQGVALWMANNRGALTDVSLKCGVTPQFVHMVLNGRRKSSAGDVEAELRKVGAPVRPYLKGK